MPDRGTEASAWRLPGRLYAITPDDLPWAALKGMLDAALAAGVRAVQYRRKHLPRASPAKLAEARALREMTRAVGAALIVNDDVALARAVSADGVHWGRDDAPVDNTDELRVAIADARSTTSPSFVVGVSCYNALGRAEKAMLAGASYVAFGAVWPSPTKPDAVAAPLSLFAEARRRGWPSVAIGGITRDNASTTLAAGADALAVISALFSDADAKMVAARVADLNARINPKTPT
jgi:thiamine-phosphate pyrophosphorylase